ncbi:MAG: DUF4878 domain-containing protein [Spirochaetales bacterium]|nr:DUF4878 domain-containing protein [Spirochaetales bacterium]
MKLMVKVCLTVLVLSALLSSCGPANTPEGVTKAFIDAMTKLDFDKASNYVTAEGKQMLKMMAGFGKDAMGEEAKEMEKTEYEIGTARIEGDNAWVPVTAEGETQEIQLTKENGKWLVVFDKEGMMNKE